MDLQNAHMLNELNKRFYATYAESFSRTRENPWKGWERLGGYIGNAGTVLDVACGNMRFEPFVESLEAPSQPQFYCVDACRALASCDLQVTFKCLDIVDLCLEGESLSARIDAAPFDLVVSFGFFHHVPGFEARKALLGSLVQMTAEGGFLAVSFWQFMNDAKIAAKAIDFTSRMQGSLGVALEKGDYLLGWQGFEEACRYCHSFCDAEIDELFEPFEHDVTIVEKYCADGKGVPLNTYVVARRR